MDAELTERQKEVIEGLASGQITIYCGQHYYFGPNLSGQGAPAAGCPDCWKVFYFHSLRDCPPGEIQERVERMEAAVHHLIEADAAGVWDLKLFDHPIVTIEKDADA